MRRYLILFITLVVGSKVAAQAWTQASGEAYFKVTQGFSIASERYDSSGNLVPYNINTQGEFRDRSTYGYAEVGVSDHTTFVGQLSYKRLYVTDESFSPAFERKSFAWGSVGLGARIDIGPSLQLDENSLTRLAVNLAASFPLGYTRNYDPAVGSGQVDLEATIDVGRSLWPLPGYVQAGVGYRYRTAFFGLSQTTVCENGLDPNEHACLDEEGPQPDFGDELLVSAEGGMQLGPILLQALVDAQWSFRDPASLDDAGTNVQPEAFELQRYVRVGAGATIYLPFDLGIGFQAFTAAHAQNALRGAQYFVGLEYKM